MEPTLETWKQLYELAVTFRQSAPWNWMWDTDLFGVQNPMSGEVGYCCVMGRLGEHFALSVSLGSEGLAGLWKMRDRPDYAHPEEMLATQKCLMLSFEDRDMLQKPDTDTIRRLGLKFRGRNAWPQFRSYRPGYHPWYLTAEEADFLLVALEQALEVALRFRENPALLKRSRPKSVYLVRVLDKNGESFEWKDVWKKPAPESPTPPMSVLLDKERVARLKSKLPRSRERLELDYSYLPSAIYGEGDERPWYPYFILAVDSASGMVLAGDMTAPSEIASSLPETLLSVIERSGLLPGTIAVQRAEAVLFLEPTVHALGLRLERVVRLPALEEARESFSSFLSG